MRPWAVRDIMTTSVVSVNEYATYRDLVDVLTTTHFSGLPVVDYFGHVAGVVSESDLMHRVERGGRQDRRRLFRGLFRGRDRRAVEAKLSASVAGELMNTPALTVTPDTPLGDAARLLHAEGVKRLPVVDDLGRLVGIVTRGDVLRVFLRDDGAIRQDVTQEVLGHILAVEPDAVRVTVTGGVVDLAGRMGRHTEAQLAVRLTRAVPGVVDVVNRLTFEFDDTALARTHDSGHPFAAEPFTAAVVPR